MRAVTQEKWQPVGSRNSGRVWLVLAAAPAWALREELEWHLSKAKLSPRH
jgi:hypothetical protein